MRIVSLVPSITELLSDLNLEDEVVGITKFCVHPDSWFRSKTRVGGTKTLHLDKIDSLNPDLIIANKEENSKEQIEALAHKYDLIVTEIKTLEDNLDLIQTLGEKTVKDKEAAILFQKFEKAIGSTKKLRNTSAVYLIWWDPIMTVGGDTYIHHVMEHIGIFNVFGEKTRYPTCSIDEIKGLSPEMILLSSEPFPFKQKHVDALKADFPKTEIKLVDGEAFSWYGSRFIKKTDYLSSF